MNTLYAECALFNNSTLTHRYIRIENQTTQVRIHVVIELFVIGVFEPIEPSDFIRTVIYTILGPHATVVSHLIEAFAAVIGCRNRTNIFAGCIVAMLTHQRLKNNTRIGRIAVIIAVDSDPVHDTAFHNFLFSNYRNIIFGLTGNYTCTATDALIQVNGYRPVMACKFSFFIKCCVLFLDRKSVV